MKKAIQEPVIKAKAAYEREQQQQLNENEKYTYINSMNAKTEISS